MEMLENGWQPHSAATPLFSVRTELQASLQSCRSVDPGAWCKRTLNPSSRKAQRFKPSQVDDILTAVHGFFAGYNYSIWWYLVRDGGTDCRSVDVVPLLRTRRVVMGPGK